MIRLHMTIRSYDYHLIFAADVIAQTFRMTHNKVPAQETTYQCQYMELSNDRDYHLIASEPYIDNANVMHHIIFRGCPDSVSEYSDKLMVL